MMTVIRMTMITVNDNNNNNNNNNDPTKNLPVVRNVTKNLRSLASLWFCPICCKAINVHRGSIYPMTYYIINHIVYDHYGYCGCGRRIYRLSTVDLPTSIEDYDAGIIIRHCLGLAKSTMPLLHIYLALSCIRGYGRSRVRHSTKFRTLMSLLRLALSDMVNRQNNGQQ